MDSLPLIVLATLFACVCVAATVLFAWRREPLIRHAVLVYFIMNCGMAAVQITPWASNVNLDRWRYLEAQAQLARYLRSLSFGRMVVEIGAGLVEQVVPAREAIGSQAPSRVVTDLNPAQVTLGSLMLLATDGWELAPGLLWATVISLATAWFFMVVVPRIEGWRRWALIVFVILSPASAWFRTINEKEPLILALTLLTVGAVIRIMTEGARARTVVLLVASLGAMVMFRPPYLLILGFVLLVGLAFARRPTFTVWAVGVVVGVGLFVVALFPQLVMHSGPGALAAKEVASYYFQEMLNARSDYGAGSASTGMVGADFMRTALQQGPRGLIYTPLFIVYYTVGPFPWQTGSMLMQFAKIQAIVYWPVVVLLIANLLSWWRLEPQHRVMLIASWGLIVIMSILEANLGTAMRHRTTFEPLLFYAAFCTPLPRPSRAYDFEAREPARVTAEPPVGVAAPVC